MNDDGLNKQEHIYIQCNSIDIAAATQNKQEKREEKGHRELTTISKSHGHRNRYIIQQHNDTHIKHKTKTKQHESQQ